MNDTNQKKMSEYINCHNKRSRPSLDDLNNSQAQHTNSGGSVDITTPSMVNQHPAAWTNDRI